jgi:hypothetical protein
VSISPITDSPSNSDPVVQQQSIQSSSQNQQGPLTGTGTQNTEDSVKLSQEAQVDQMALQGESASLIAMITGLSVGEIDNDLGISTSTSSIPVASSGGHGGGHPAAPVHAAAPAAASNAATAGPTATSAPRLSVSA